MLDQSFVCVHRGTVYAYIFVGVSVRVLWIFVCVSWARMYCVLKKMNCTLGHLLLPKFYFGLGYIWCFHFGPGYVTFYRTLNHSRVPYLWPTLLHPSILYSDHPTPWFSFLIFFSHQNNVRWEKSFDCELDFVRSSSGTDPRGGMWLLRLIHGSISMEKKISTLIFFLTLFSPTKIMWAEKNHLIVSSQQKLLQRAALWLDFVSLRSGTDPTEGIVVMWLFGLIHANISMEKIQAPWFSF